MRDNLRNWRWISSRAVTLAALASLLFAVGSTPALAALPTISLQLDKTTAAPGQLVTMTAIVSSADGNPTGVVKFFNGSVQLGDTQGVALVPVPGSSTQSQAVLTQSFTSGTYSITASYRNKAFITTTAPPITLVVGRPDLHNTAIQLTAVPPTVLPGETVTLTATVTEVNGSGVPTGLVTFDDNGIPFSPVNQVLLDANGQATLTVQGFGPGDHVIHASYAGSVVDTSSATSTTFTVPDVASQAVDTTITVTASPTHIHQGDTVTITAHVVQVGRATTPAAGGLVTFTANGVPLDPGTALLDANGNATVVVRGWQQTGDYDIQASYVGDIFSNPSTGNTTIGVLDVGAPLSIATHLAYTGATSGVFGDNAQLAAVLTDDSGNPVANENVTLTLGSQSCLALTDATGLATCSIALTQDPSTYDIRATFAGDGLLLASSASGSFAIGRQATTLTYTGATSADYGDAATLSATLVGATGLPLAGKTIAFALGSQSCTATTGTNGVASCSIAQVTQAPGSPALSATFAGDDIYLSASSSTPTTFLVRREVTTAAIAPLGPVAAGVITLRGTVFEDGLPLAGAPVTLSLGSASCTATTNAAGSASCTVTVTTLGPASLAITYVGNANYVGSSASTTTSGALIYAFAAGGGSFVIGDGNAAPGTAVTFWGDKWAKLNSVSGGTAPDSFKGWAVQSAQRCGTTWTAGPGDSAKPPAGPLPAYMAVLVTGSVAKSGSTVSGNTVHIVVVQTAVPASSKDKDAGYKNDPGHPGTGTVVATVC